MSKFKLKETTIQISSDDGTDMDVTVRQMTYADNVKMVSVLEKNPENLHAFLMSTCCVNPTWTFDEALMEPPTATKEIVGAILGISGMDEVKKKARQEKEVAKEKAREEQAAKDKIEGKVPVELQKETDAKPTV